MELRQRSQAEFARLLLPLARRWRRKADDAVADLGLSHASGWTLLHIGRLGDKEGVRQAELADALDMRAPSLIPQIDRLQAAGLIVREALGHDRRANRLRLTCDGRMLVGRIETALGTIRDAFFEGVSQSDVDAALRVLTHLDKSLAAASQAD